LRFEIRACSKGIRPASPDSERRVTEGSRKAMEPPPLSHQSLRLILEESGLRCTPQRLAVYDQLCVRAHHPTAEQVFQAVRSTIPRISLATVYKALESLVAVGAATKVTAGIGQASARYDARRDVHYHFRCLRTGAILDLPTNFDPDLITKLDPELSDYLQPHGFQVMGYHLELLGFQGQDRDPEATVATGLPISQASPSPARTSPDTSGAADS
jgi:Fur family transcriptional regulator, peroxide stress response regulator